MIEKTHKGRWDKEYNLIIPTMKAGDFEKFDKMTVDKVNNYFSSKSLMSISEYAKKESIDITNKWLWDNAFRIFGSKSNKSLVKQTKDICYHQQIVCYQNADGNKRFFRSDYNKGTKDPRIELVRAESNSSVFLSDNWTDISNDGGVAQEGGVIYPNGKKPLFLIQRIIRATNMKNATILDFFADSGTTLHAAITINKEDSGRRKCILVQAKENDTNICRTVTYKRCLNVINGCNNTAAHSSNTLRYYKTDFIPRERTPKNMRALVAAATDLLCIKNDIYTEAKLAGQNINPKIARYFEGGKGKMLIIYDERAIAAIVDILKTIETNGEKIMVYLFSPSSYAYEDEFIEVANRVQLCALPDALYNVYQKVLPKRCPKYLTETLVEKEG